MRKERFLVPDQRRNREIRRVAEPADWLQPSRRINSGLLIITLILVCFGLIMLFSASMSDGYASKSGNSMFYVIKQAGITAMGLAVALILALIIPARFFDRFWLAILAYGLTTGLLVYVKFFGLLINGARRWVSIGVQFQPSELAKLAVVYCFASYVSMIRRQRARGKLRFRTPLRQFLADGWLDILLPGAAMLLWIGLIAWQPHVSGAMILAFLVLVAYLAAGIRPGSWLSGLVQLLVILLVIALLAGAAIPFLPADKLDRVEMKVSENFQHVTERIVNFLNPDQASKDDTYQVDQSIIAIGSGGLSGIGLGAGRQKYNYLPEAHNDFVFAIIGEELGFAGTVCVLLLFVLFLFIGVSITLRAASPYMAILAAGYTMLISIQALLNIAVATKTLPPTGVSLPFFSYGGTSNLFFLLAIGFILAVSRTGQRSQRDFVTTRAKPLAVPGGQT
jgi:cell division protein FtsW